MGRQQSLKIAKESCSLRQKVLEWEIVFKDLEIGRYYWILSLYLLMKEWIGSANGYVTLEYTYIQRSALHPRWFTGKMNIKL